MNRFSAGVVNAEVDGMAVDDDAESDRKKSIPRLSASQWVIQYRCVGKLITWAEMAWQEVAPT